MTTTTSTGLLLRSTVKKEGLLELSLAEVPIPEPKPDEVVVRVEASPINPSDLGLLFGGADMGTAKASGTADRPVVTATIGPEMMHAAAARIDQPMSVGNEGAGVVVSAGSSPAAQALLGKTVAMLGGAMYAQYRAIKAVHCLVLPEGATPADGASCFVNPLTASAWWRPCAAKATRRSCTRRRHRTSVRCWSSSATRKGSASSTSCASRSR